ncbi:MAG: hypothetical protein ACK5A9_19580, partial [Pseudanabaena sp.]
MQNKLPKPIKLRSSGTQLYGFWFVVNHAHLLNVTIDGDKLDKVAMDAEVLEALRDNGLFPEPPKVGQPAPTALEVLKRLEARIQARLAGNPSHKVWKSLVE